MSSDKIIAQGMQFFGCHGVLPEEKKKPQPFVVDVEMSLDLAPAGRSDNLADTVSYDEVFHTVRRIVENCSFNLIEALAETIAEKLLSDFAVQEVEVTVYKPQAPVEGKFNYFAIKIKRFRQ